MITISKKTKLKIGPSKSVNIKQLITLIVITESQDRKRTRRQKERKVEEQTERQINKKIESQRLRKSRII